MVCDTCFSEHQAEDTCPGVTQADVRSIRAQVARLTAALEGIFQEYTPEHLDDVSKTTVGSDAHASLSGTGEGCPNCACLTAALELAKHKAEQIRDGQCNPNARARAIIQVAGAALAALEEK